MCTHPSQPAPAHQPQSQPTSRNLPTPACQHLPAPACQPQPTSSSLPAPAPCPSLPGPSCNASAHCAPYYCYGYIWVRWRTSGRMQAKSSTQTERPGTKRWHGQCPDPLLLQQVHTTNTGSGGGRRGSIRQLWGAAGKTLANYRAPQAEITLIIGRTRAPYAEIVASIVRRRRKYWTACSLWKRWQQETSNVLRVSFIAPGKR